MVEVVLCNQPATRGALTAQSGGVGGACWGLIAGLWQTGQSAVAAARRCWWEDTCDIEPTHRLCPYHHGHFGRTGWGES